MYSAIEVTNDIVAMDTVYVSKASKISSMSVKTVDVTQEMEVNSFQIQNTIISNGVIENITNLTPTSIATRRNNTRELETAPLIITTEGKNLSSSSNSVVTFGTSDIITAVGELSGVSFVNFAQPLITTDNEIDETATLTIEGAPEVIEGTGTISNSYALYVDDGAIVVNDTTAATGDTASIVIDGGMSIQGGNIVLAENYGVTIGDNFQITRVAGESKIISNTHLENVEITGKQVKFKGKNLSFDGSLSVNESAYISTNTIPISAAVLIENDVITGPNQTIVNNYAMTVKENTEIEDFAINSYWSVYMWPAQDLTYTTHTPNISFQPISSVAYSPSLNLYVAVNGKRSTDFINWTGDVIGIDTYSIMWIESAVLGNVFVIGANNALLYSSNGITWTTIVLPHYVNCMAYGNDTIVACENTEKVYVFNSFSSYTTVTVPPAFTESLDYITFGNGVFCIVSFYLDDQQQTMTSPDGINWTLSTNIGNCAKARIGGIGYLDGPELFVLYNRQQWTSGEQAYLYPFTVSNNGLNWNFSNSTTYMNARDIIWIPKYQIAMAVMYDYNLDLFKPYMIYLSRDGYNWFAPYGLKNIYPNYHINLSYVTNLVWNESDDTVSFAVHRGSSSVYKIKMKELVDPNYTIGTLGMTSLSLDSVWAYYNNLLNTRASVTFSTSIAGLTSSKFYSYSYGNMFICFFVVVYTGTGGTITISKLEVYSVLAYVAHAGGCANVYISTNGQPNAYARFTSDNVVTIGGTSGFSVVTGKMVIPFYTQDR